jgi:hypothetical protein
MDAAHHPTAFYDFCHLLQSQANLFAVVAN